MMQQTAATSKRKERDDSDAQEGREPTLRKLDMTPSLLRKEKAEGGTTITSNESDRYRTQNLQQIIADTPADEPAKASEKSVEVSWRELQGFADQLIERLASRWNT